MSSSSASTDAFNAARRRALVQDVLAELSGRPDDLLSFGDVREQLHLSELGDEVHLEEIPLEKIVGSVGRYRDFNRAFLPRDQIDAQRWTRIDRLHGHAQLPPIDVFRVDDVYFVRDGNHRVSVARARGQRTIRARVVDVPARVPLEEHTSPADLILKSGYTDFLEKTSLDRAYPEQRIELTRPGSYRDLLKHIEVHQFYMGLRSRHYPSLAEAAADWYAQVYTPVVTRIRESGILQAFPGRTEADLYLWISENRARLQMRYSTNQEADQAVDDFAQAHRQPRLWGWLQRAWQRLFPRRPPAQPGASAPPEGER
jgi:uncharacterized ParB-like nuclease family protein